MTEINRVSGSGSASPISSDKELFGKSPPTQEKPSGGSADNVNLSEVSQVLHRISQAPGISAQRVEEVRQQVAQGRFTSETKVKEALGHFLTEVFGF